MRDLPEATALLALARDVLLNDLLPLLPPERQLDTRLVANCMAIAERELAAQEPGTVITGELEALYRPEGLSSSRFAGPSLSLTAGEGLSRSKGGEGADPRSASRGEANEGHRAEDDGVEPLHRFARELRNGEFENSPEHAAFARAILWRLTIAKLRLANPRFLAANGYS
jgi:hypothetical protein